MQLAARNFGIRYLWIDSVCIYSYRTATEHLGILSLHLNFLRGFILWIWLVRSGHIFFRVLKFEIYHYAFCIRVAFYPKSERWVKSYVGFEKSNCFARVAAIMSCKVVYCNSIMNIPICTQQETELRLLQPELCLC
jgi:hypothetical protein